MKTDVQAVFDFPTGWASLEPTNPEHHHERCSYRQANRGLLCDCAAIHAARRAYELGIQHANEGRVIKINPES